jgi:ATP-dependent DNA helicase RecQ
MQAEIIDSVLAGRDTLGLLPTGGGKSITFQVPSLLLPGLTVVVTPLISLMKDQVDNLRAHDIPAAYIHSGLTRREHRLALDRAYHGKIKLLYLSPERLQSEQFVQELRGFNVSLIVVDEAHCISQWGYDFRPSYLKIANLRKAMPSVPVMALTASATEAVVQDIMDQLQFRRRTNCIFRRSFARENISYVVRYGDNKPERLLRVLRATSGTAIVYVRSRVRTREISDMLRAAGISADYYHAGLAPEDKDARQQAWKSDQVRVMVATNAFGMGIDKPDVRVVVHFDLPSSLEEYYQEAGRAGRDGRPSFAVVLARAGDKATLARRLNASFPPKPFIADVYEKACLYIDLCLGEGRDHSFDFNLTTFCRQQNFNESQVRSALRLLGNAGYVQYLDDVETRARVMVIADKRELYSFHFSDDEDAVLQHLLRAYPGLFADYVQISEEAIASALMMTDQRVYETLLALNRMHAIHYVPRRSMPFLYFPTRRVETRHVELPRSVYEDMRQRMADRLEAMRSFTFDSHQCRANTILRYFGETPTKPCGCCDVCRENRQASAASGSMPDLRQRISYVCRRPVTIDQLAATLGLSHQAMMPTLRAMLDEEQISYNNDNFLISNLS